jgi:nicotinate phosphoribosyltransferase
VAGGLLTDLYELNMAASYPRRSVAGQATFSLFVRALPPGRGFLVAAGLADCLQFLEDFSFTADDLSYLRQTRGYREDTLRAFAGLRFTGEVRAVPEGRVVFAGEPLLEVTAPVAEAQLAETVLLNHVTFQTAVATKAARCVLAAGGAQLVDFSFRRTQGIDAGLAVARASAIAGSAATSNVAAARRYGLAAAGTMAHSFIEAFGDERAAFAAFAGDFPGLTTFLVDTYDTARGVRNAIEVTRRVAAQIPAVRGSRDPLVAAPCHYGAAAAAAGPEAYIPGRGFIRSALSWPDPPCRRLARGRDLLPLSAGLGAGQSRKQDTCRQGRRSP